VSPKPPSDDRPNVAAAVQERYTTGARRLATQSVTGLARTRVTPNSLTVSGVTLCIVGSALVWFEYRDELLFFWLGAALFAVGSILDILDGALARAGGKTTPFGGFLDSTTDRVGEGFMLGAIALVFARDGLDWAIALAFASLAGSFLVSYTRAKAEIMGLKGEIGFGGRAERVAVLVAGLVFAPWGGLPWAIVFLTALTWLTVVQRIWGVRSQMLSR
jgi:CDP-diacylglycerol--glycerol-3-phosphate 3-phosphatidyltransferase